MEEEIREVKKSPNLKKTLAVFGIIFAIIIFLLFVVGKRDGTWVCNNNKWTAQGNPSYPKPEDPCGVKIALPKNQEDCLKIEGVWGKLGPDPFETCNVKARDRGNICHDSSECMGMCQVILTKEELSQGMRGKLNSSAKYGQCSVWVVELGCFGMMKNGKAQVICID